MGRGAGGSSEELEATTPIEIERHAGPVLLTGAQSEVRSSQQNDALGNASERLVREPEAPIFKTDARWSVLERRGPRLDLMGRFQV